MFEQLKTILLNHKGKHNPITSAQIAFSLDIKEDDTHAKKGALIRDCARKYELPLVANHRGYYLVDYAKARCEKEKPFEERSFPSRALPFPNLFEPP